MLSANLDRLEIIPFIQPQLKEVLIKARDLVDTNPEPGRYVIDDDKVFVLIMDAKTGKMENCRPELHNNYIDIQVLLEGAEAIGYGHMPVSHLTEDLLAEKDVAFTDAVTAEKLIALAPRDFALFYPGEVHRPLVALKGEGTAVRKAVVKVHRTLFE